MFKKIRSELIGFIILIATLFLVKEVVLRFPSWEYWNYPSRAYNACLVIVTGFAVIRILWLLLRKKTS